MFRKNYCLLPKFTNSMNICCNYKHNLYQESKQISIIDKLCLCSSVSVEFVFGLFTINKEFIDYIYRNYNEYINSLLNTENND